jgi:hypothetical protein
MWVRGQLQATATLLPDTEAPVYIVRVVHTINSRKLKYTQYRVILKSLRDV